MNRRSFFKAAAALAAAPVLPAAAVVGLTPMTGAWGADFATKRDAVAVWSGSHMPTAAPAVGFTTNPLFGDAVGRYESALVREAGQRRDFLRHHQDNVVAEGGGYWLLLPSRRVPLTKAEYLAARGE